jgi:hypothetical protein
MSSSEFEIRSARADDWAVLRTLLPAVVHFGAGTWNFLAEDLGGMPVGALAMERHLSGQGLPGMRVAIRIVEGSNARGAAEALLAAAEKVAAQHRAAALHAWNVLPIESHEAAVWRAHGFTHETRVVEARLDVAAAEAFLAQRWERIEARRGVPAGVTIEALRDVPADVAAIAARWHAAHFGGSEARLLDQVFGRSVDRFDPDLSQILRVNGRVVGTMLAFRSGDESRAEGTVIDPAFRGGWANVLLKLHSFRNGRMRGVTTAVFYTFDQHADTRKFAQRMGASVRERVALARPMGARAPQA